MIKYHNELVQGTDEWLAARCGLLTASEMKLIITPTLKIASNEKERAHLYELAAQRITKYVEPSYISDDMLRGMTDEGDAKIKYTEKYGVPIQEVGFITNDKWGFTIGYSPDGLIGNDGQIECKSRRQKFQIETILSGECPADYMIQIQTGMLASERSWCDFVTYSAGLPMMTVRVHPDDEIQKAILDAAAMFEGKLQKKIIEYHDALAALPSRFIETERKIYDEEIIV